MTIGDEGKGTSGNPVLAEVGEWEGVHIEVGERGEASVRCGRVEIGHMHGPRVAHFGFPKPLWRELIAEEIVDHHPVGMEGWAERRIENSEDLAEVVDLFRLNYERLRAMRTAGRARRAAGGAGRTADGGGRSENGARPADRRAGEDR
jgi:hypothetical protein